MRTVGDLLNACGPDRRVALCRELTKLHEEVWRGTLDLAVAHVAATEPIGEYVVVLAGAAPPSPASDEDVTVMLQRYLAAGISTRDAVARVASDTGRVKRDVYALAVASPGPGVAAVVARTLGRGTGGALKPSLGRSTGDSRRIRP